MNDRVIVVSLLGDEAASEAVLAETRVLLPPARRTTTLLLRSLGGPAPVAEVIEGLPPGTVVLVDDESASRPLMAAAPSLRVVVWCRTDGACTAWNGTGAVAIVAATPSEVAWELVRSMTQESGLAIAAGGATPELTARSQPGVAAAPPPILQVVNGARREASIPPAPSWATRPTAAIDRPSGVRSVSLPAPASWAFGLVEAEAVAPPEIPAPLEEQPEDVPSRVPEAPSEAVEPAAYRPTYSWTAAPPPLAAIPRFHPAVPTPTRPDSEAELPPAPFAALATMLPPLSDPGAAVPPARAQPPTAAPTGERTGRGSRLALPFLRREPSFSAQAADDARRLAEWRSTLLGVWNIKGGTGKTTLAGTIGILGAQLVEPLGGRTLVIEGNPGNPDQGTFLGVPATAPTVRDVMRALARGATVPEGEYARDARCRVLPEPRGNPSAYSAAEVRRFVTLVRGINTVIVVDLGNAAPSQAQGSREALVEHWMPHADVWVIPIDLGEASFVGAGECLDAIEEQASRLKRGMPGIVVPLLLPPGGRRATRVPEIAELLDHLREVGAEVVEVPYLIEINVAQHQRRTVVGRDPKVTRAFEPVLRAVVRARDRHVGGGHA